MMRPDGNPLVKSGLRPKSSLLQRISLLGMIMAMLVAAAGAISYSFPRGAALDIRIMRQAADQAIQISLLNEGLWQRGVLLQI